MVNHIYYIKFALQFANMQIGQLVSEFNRQACINAWTSMRAHHDRALIDEFQNRGVDLSPITHDGNICFKYKVYYDLQSNRLIPIG